MLNYQVAKLIEWADVLRSRKRAQKVTYLLKAAGAHLDADYRLHQYGPYSEDIAGAIDDLVRRDFVTEQSHEERGDTQYDYLVSGNGRAAIASAEFGAAAAKLAKFRSFEALARDLLPLDVAQLETTATIAYFAPASNDWVIAVGRACRYRGVDPGTSSFQAAVAIARKAIGANDNLKRLLATASPH